MEKISPLFAVRAEEFLKVGKLKKAVRLSKAGIKVFPEYQTAYIVLTKAYFLLDKRKKTLKTVNKAIKAFPLSEKIFDLRKHLIENSILKKDRKTFIVIPSIVLGFIQLIFFLITIPALFPSLAGQTAETMRKYFGVQFVTQLEEISLSAFDFVNQIKYNFGDKQDMNFNSDGAGNDTRKQTVEALNKFKFSQKHINNSGNSASTALYQKIIKNDDSSNKDWGNFIKVNDEIIMFDRKICPDPKKPYSQIYLIKIRLDKIKLHFSPGGVIPDERQNDRLLAAFNGGFRYAHGKYGMMSDSKIIYKPKENLATLYLYKDDRIELGTWKSDKANDSNIIAFRQNCPLMLENGEISKLVKTRHGLWGATIDNAILTWRSGIGITADRKYLIYGFGKSITVDKLAMAFREAGANTAMQLDINAGWTKFVLFNTEKEVTAQKVVNSFSSGKYEYLRKSGNYSLGRDFFYLTYR
ncbi:MAG: phosphodiester glycosidase family protein [Bacteroidota bacterium]